ncbi:anti-sigma-D factor RsdA [Mycobacterium sp. DL440]|uniref:anti-sigma-D factor RsdA n=1 Tax=Mycobacterium sp. DL440 TaxID=2675523 RepID=UPI00141DC0FC|nr:anti-sigma-D factor RsdA [Mycobacterium sp. DL440]
MPDFGRWTSNGGDPSLNEINRSEKFIEALSLEHQVYATDREEAELAVLLTGWRDDARRTPMSGIATPREAVKALDKATAQGRVRFPMALVGSMAAAVLCLGGFGAAVYGSGPGDALYGVRGLVFGSAPVTRDVGVELASSELKQVQQLIDDGQWDQAQQKLQTITTTVATIDDEQRKQQLVDQWQQLSVKVENRDPNATVPPDAPPVVLPEVTVTTTPYPSESTPGETPTSTPTTGPSTSPTEPSPGSETSTPSTSPSENPTSQPTTTQPSTPSSSTAAPTPSSSAEPTTSAPAPATAPSQPVTQSSATHTTSAPTTSAAPAAEAPPATTTVAPSVEPTSVPSAPPVRTTPAAPAETGSGESHGSPSGGHSGEGPAMPAIEVPLLPGLDGGQR